mgnify:CR=1 FL=1
MASSLESGCDWECCPSGEKNWRELGLPDRGEADLVDYVQIGQHSGRTLPGFGQDMGACRPEWVVNGGNVASEGVAGRRSR